MTNTCFMSVPLFLGIAICAGWYFAHMWTTLAWPHHITKRRGFLLKYLYQAKKVSGHVYVC